MNDSVVKKVIPVEDSVGMVLPHDITEIVKDSFKGRAFKKGHVITNDDVEKLRSLGKNNIYVLELSPDDIHENEAALLLAKSIAGEGVSYDRDVVEGKVEIIADRSGLLKVDVARLLALNMLGDVMCSTLHNNSVVRKNDVVAGTRMIPLVAKRKLIDRAKEILSGDDKLLKVLPLKKAKVGLVITGSEVFYGKIEDRFADVLKQKMIQFGSEVIKVCFAPDDVSLIAREIRECIKSGADFIITSGGMSVDPDDVTRQGIAAAGGKNMVYGSPVLPGAMFMVATIADHIPLLGVPACGMFNKITVLDLVLPRILSGEKIGRKELASLGHGGLCRNCEVCTYPVCSFGK